MNEELLKYYLKNLKKDIKILKDNKFQKRTHDLLNMVLLEDIPELIKFMERVIKALDYEMESTGQYMAGFKDGMDAIKREIYNLEEE